MLAEDRRASTVPINGIGLFAFAAEPSSRSVIAHRATVLLGAPAPAGANLLVAHVTGL